MKLSNSWIKYKLFIAAVLALHSYSAGASPLAVNDWTTETAGENETAFASGNSVALSVYKTSWAEAEGELGDLNGTITMTLNWTITADDWWENPYIGVLTNPAPSAATCAAQLTPLALTCSTLLSVGAFTMPVGGTTSGEFTATFAVDGDTSLIFGLAPSPYSANGDHFWTYLDANDITLNYTPSATIPEPSTISLIGVSLLGLALLRKNSRI